MFLKMMVLYKGNNKLSLQQVNSLGLTHLKQIERTSTLSDPSNGIC